MENSTDDDEGNIRQKVCLARFHLKTGTHSEQVKNTSHETRGGWLADCTAVFPFLRLYDTRQVQNRMLL